MEKSLLKELREVVINFDEEGAKSVAEKVLESGMDPYQAIVQGLTPAIKEVGVQFEKGEAFLPELIMAADAMSAAVNILEKGMSKEQSEATKKGIIVIGTVKGDVHNIGKNIVGIMLKVEGYEVVDLGVEVAPSEFIEVAEKSNADIIMASALMTFTASSMQVITEYMEMQGVRHKYKLLFGGGPLTEYWAKEMGADAYAPDAVKAVKVVNKLMGY